MSLVSKLKGQMSLPVIGAPMFIVGVPALVIEQCINGVIGSFPALNARPAELLDSWLEQIESAHFSTGPAVGVIDDLSVRISCSCCWRELPQKSASARSWRPCEHIGAQHDVHQVAQGIGNANQVMRLGCLPVLVQLLLNQAYPEGDRLRVEIRGRRLFQVRAEDAVKFLQHAQLLDQRDFSFYVLLPILA